MFRTDDDWGIIFRNSIHCNSDDSLLIKLTIYCNLVKRLTKHVMLSGYCIQGKLRDFSWLNCKLIHTQTLSPKTNRNSQLQYIPLGNNQRASNNIRLTYPLQITHMGLQITIIFKIKSTERIHNVSKNIKTKNMVPAPYLPTTKDWPSSSPSKGSYFSSSPWKIRL